MKPLFKHLGVQYDAVVKDHMHLDQLSQETTFKFPEDEFECGHTVFAVCIAG